jgi:formate dehydrogenase subunit delta
MSSSTPAGENGPRIRPSTDDDRADHSGAEHDEPRSMVPDLIRMANQIALNFAHHPADQAAGEVAEHLRAFWTPAMRAELEDWAAQGGEELHPLALEAVGVLSRASG